MRTVLARAITLILLMGTAELNPQDADAQDCTSYEEPRAVGRTNLSGTYHDMTRVGTLAYLVDDIALKIVDASVPQSPSARGSLPMPATPRSVAVSGNYAYLTDSAGFRVIDISDPDNPALVQGLAVPSLSGLAVTGGFAYVAKGIYGLQVIDVTTPTAPLIVGLIPFTAEVRNVTAADSYIYIASGTNVFIYDLVDPRHPSSVGSVSALGTVMSIAVSGDRAYACTSTGSIGLHSLNITNPAAPQHAGWLETPRAALDVVVDSGYAYIADGALEIIDVGDPAVPQLMRTVSASGNATAVGVTGGYAYTSSDGYGLEVYDISHQSFPDFLGQLDSVEYAEDIVAIGNYVYVADGYNGLRIVSVANPTVPVIVGSEDGYPNRFEGQCIAVQGSYAYLTGGLSPTLVIVSILNPSNPSVVGRLALPDRAYGVAVSGDFAYVANFQHGLQVIDVSAPASPYVAGTVATGDYAMTLAYANGYVYLNNYSRLCVIDVTNPYYPHEVSSVGVGGDEHTGMCASGDVLYVAASSLYLVDVSRPLAPLIITTYSTTGVATDVAISGHYAYVTTYMDSGFEVLDIASPLSVLLVGRLESEGNSFSIAVSDSFVCLAETAFPAMLRIAALQCGSAVSAIGDDAPRSAGAVGRIGACPNPFNPRTTIRFDLPAAGSARLAIYDLAGRLVRVLVEGEIPAGSHEAVWDGRDASGRDAPSGTYLARLVAGGKVEGVRVSLVR